MPRTLEQIKDDIKSRLSIVDVVSSRVQLRQAGSAWKACCPFHKEKTPSFTVNPSTGFYKCFGCGEAGDIFTFLMKNDGMSFMDALKTLAERCGVTVDLSHDSGENAAAKRLLALHAELADFYRKCLVTMKSAAKARAYLASRALPAQICEEFCIGYAPAGARILESFAQKRKYSLEEMIQGGLATANERPRHDGADLYDRFKGRLMFPIRDTQGRVIAFSGRIIEANDRAAKYVNSPETAIFKKSFVLFALDKAQRHIAKAPHREALVCEGQLDVIRCHACGFPRAVASQGTAFTEEHARLLARYADSVTLVFDQDSAGQKAAVKTGSLLSACGFPVRVATMPEGEDPDSFLRKNPPQVFQQILDDAQDIIPFQTAYFAAQESDPNSEGAIERISSQALETISAVNNEIRKARMLQQLSDLIRIPPEALQAELRRADAQRETAAARAEQNRNREPARPPVTSAPSPAQLPALPAPEPLLQGAGKRKETRRAAPPPQLEVAICELAVQSFSEDAEVAEFAKTHIHEKLFSNPLCRKIFLACLADCDGGSALSDLQNTDADAAALIGAIASASCKTTGRESFSPIDAARELALRAWKRHCLANADSIPADSADINKRLELKRKTKRLDTWENGASLIAEMFAAENSAPPPILSAIAIESAPLNSANSADVASGEAAENGSAPCKEDGGFDSMPDDDELIPDFGDDFM